ncbi:hypothetical protein ASD88_00900 [Pelomonas sp. Root662]|nr:hypothetical protein ASC81_00900 [Pelomonas sp. Root405]KRA77472.1 hypothetical protein ASD88_00900 [Pelomonas sp. Root662]
MNSFIRREGQPAVLQRRPYPLAGFLDLGVGQAHHGEARQAVGQVDFHRDRRGGEAVEGAAVDGGEGHQ